MELVKNDGRHKYWKIRIFYSQKQNSSFNYKTNTSRHIDINYYKY